MAVAMYGGGTGTIPGVRTNQGSEAYGYRPLVPSPGASAGQAIGTNAGNLGALYGLAGGLDTFEQQQMIQNLARGLPGYQPNIEAASRNTSSLLGGQIPADVIAQMQQQAAERGILAPGPNANAAYLAAIGRTSLDLNQLGESNLTAEINRTPKAPLYDPSQMFVTPDQIQQAASAANLYASAPNPAAAAEERLRIAQMGGAERPTGGLLGVNRGGGGPTTPYDMQPGYTGTIGPYGAFPGAIDTYTPTPWAPPAPSAFNPQTMGYGPGSVDPMWDFINQGGGGMPANQGFEASEYAPQPDLFQGTAYDYDYLNQAGSDYYGDLSPEEVEAY